MVLMIRMDNAARIRGQAKKKKKERKKLKIWDSSFNLYTTKSKFHLSDT